MILLEEPNLLGLLYLLSNKPVYRFALANILEVLERN